MPLDRSQILPETSLPDSEELLERGRLLAQDWKVEAGAFLKTCEHDCEANYKREAAASKRVMQHAQMGFRDLGRSCQTWAEIYESCKAKNVTVARYGITLDWSMGQVRSKREDAQRGTGLILNQVEDFVRLTEGAPVAPHFGDFVLGFPASIENTIGALTAGSTSIGNLGQYFTFRLPGDDADITATESTVTALGLIASQDLEVLVHSNLDDGYTALFTDLASSLGAVLVEQYIVQDLIGASISHCYGHHFTDPVRRMAFQIALAEVSETPGTMIYGNTVSYQGTEAENYASLANYLTADVLGQQIKPTGHAINPVPVTENVRIPDVDEIIAAQLFAGRMIEQARGYENLIDISNAQKLARKIVKGGKKFHKRVLKGFQEAGIDIADPVEMLLALRRIGGKRLEELYGAGKREPSAVRGRKPVVQSSLVEELDEMAEEHLSKVSVADQTRLASAKLTVLTATTDVHEHGKMLLEHAFKGLGVTTIDGGVSTDPDKLAALALTTGANAIAVSTFNGVALPYAQKLKSELAQRGLQTPILIGGRLNQIPQGSNTSLPVDVSAELRAEGTIVCEELKDVVPALLSL